MIPLGQVVVNGQLPTVLDGTSVLVNGKNAYVNHVSPGQIDFLAAAGSDVDGTL